MALDDVADLGFDAERLQRVSNTLTAQIDSGYMHGAAIRVSRGGQLVATPEGRQCHEGRR